ncbi:hypothetical protein PTKIN_Ptkin02bG0223500 [Pterospermum kingtungense]
MLFAIAISLLYVEIKDSVLRRLFAELVKKFWSEWELRSMVILSLILQFLLGYFGRKRKKYTGKWVPAIAISAWLVYLSADWMATLVLSTLLRGGTNQELQNGLIVFWTPFLLWHLGSPYNITAYSLEDNELWLRHFLGMVFQIGEAIYIYIRFRTNTALNAMALPLFIGGVIKYAERIWALRCASPKQLVNFFYSSSSTSKTPNEGNGIGCNMKEMIRTGMFDLTKRRDFIGDPTISPEVKFLREVDFSFDIFKPLFADLPFQISREFHDEMVYLPSKNAEEAFNFVGLELEFVYDLLYTKIPIKHRQHRLSLVLQTICFVFLLSVLIAFSAFLHKIQHSTVDAAVTYLLLSGALSLEIYSWFMHFRSQWTMLRYAIPGNKLQKLYHRLVARRLRSIKSRKGIKQMAQHDLIDYIVKAKSSWFTPVIKLIDTANLLQKFWHSKWKPIDTELKDFIYYYLEKKRYKFDEEGKKLESLDKLLSEKGDNAIREKLGISEAEYWKMESTDFTRRIFVWHIATSLVYYDDFYKHRIGTCDSILRIGKSLSDYMMYLVLVRPTMLPNGFSEMVNKETRQEAERFFPQMHRRKRLKVSMKDFIAALLPMKNEYSPLFSQKTALAEGVKFAQQLQVLATENTLRWDGEDKWQMISEIWMDMMVYAASRCTWEEHAQQLRHGGELLTHVSLLMAHLGLSTQVHRLDKFPADDHLSEGVLPFPDFSI